MEIKLEGLLEQDGHSVNRLGEVDIAGNGLCPVVD